MEKRDQRLVQSENAIIEAGIRTFLLNPEAGMSSIAQASGVGRTTLYRHYESKAALLRSITLRCLEEIDEVLLPVSELEGRAAIEATFALLLPVADRYRFLSSLWSQIETDPVLNKKLAEYEEQTDWLMTQAKASGDVSDELPLIWLRTFFDMTLYGAWSLLETEDLTAEDAVRFASSSFFNGCGKY